MGSIRSKESHEKQTTETAGATERITDTEARTTKPNSIIKHLATIGIAVQKPQIGHPTMSVRTRSVVEHGDSSVGNPRLRSCDLEEELV